ncbi:MAG: sulfotransferase domain-containing protein [Deltaproteobacteria bacterium]|nr:MAG: sulfotransferase domain-containing protein [Deltaproteobacteria bacterium]
MTSMSHKPMLPALNFAKKRRFGPLALLMPLLHVGCRVGLTRPLLRGVLHPLMAAESTKAYSFLGYTPTEHDVFVTTFLKSGTNWSLQMAQQIACYGEADFDHIHDIVAWPEPPMPGRISLYDPAPQEYAPTGLRVIKTHLEADFVPYGEQAKYITVLRDPKEVFVSSYHFVLGILGVQSYVSVEDWLDIFTSSDALSQAWAEHTTSFWQWRERSNVLVMTFREMRKDPEDTVRQIADLMGVSLTPKQFEKVSEKSSFGYMKKHNRKFAPPWLPWVKSPTAMIRSGKSGASGELLSPEQKEHIDHHSRKAVLSILPDFPYDEVFPADPKN